MKKAPLDVAVYDTKSYDERYLSSANADGVLQFQFHSFRLTPETASTAANCRAVCVFVNDRLDAACLDRLSKSGVGMIALRCAGFNNVDLGAAKSRNLHVTRVPAYSPHAVAEHAVGLLLTLNRKIHRAYNRVREHNFQLHGLIGFDVAGKTVGIVGTGKIGRIAAQIFRGFDAKVIAYDPVPAGDWAARYSIAYVPIEELFAQSDIISLHLPLLPSTFHMLNDQAFRQMKHGVFILNTSRGKLIDTLPLLEALKSGKVGGVALDVYEEEEGIFFEDHSDKVLLDEVLSRLLTFPNVLVTSHQAFLTHEALAQIASVTVENLQRFAVGEPLLPGTIPGL